MDYPHSLISQRVVQKRLKRNGYELDCPLGHTQSDHLPYVLVFLEYGNHNPLVGKKSLSLQPLQLQLNV